MKNFNLFSALCVLTSSLLIGAQPQTLPFFTEQYATTIEKSHHRGPRGPRGHRGPQGHRGHRGHEGQAGKSVQPAWIGLSFVGDPITPNTIDISPQDNTGTVIIPFGVNDNPTIPPVLLKYYDADPLSATADRYFQVLPGGGGIYDIQFSMYSRADYNNQDQINLLLQPQVNYGSGWEATLPYNVFQTVFVQNTTPPNFFCSAGSAEAIIYLPDNAKFRIVVLTATQGLTIGLTATPLSPLQSRDVSITANRIDIP